MKTSKNPAMFMWYFYTLLFLFLNNSCDYTNPLKEIHLSESNPIEKRLVDEINRAKSNQRSSGFNTETCEITFNPQNCIELNFELTYPVDISGCATGTTATCDITAEMHLIICENANDVEVNLIETLWGHAESCILDPNNHMDDWECIMEIAFDTYISTLMPFILNVYNEYSSCEAGLNTFVSKYYREACYYPCTTFSEGYYYTRLLQCGSSTACCIQETQWCKDSLGVIHTTELPSIQIGECSPGSLPCRNSSGPFFPQWESCRTRNCLQPVID